LTVTVAFEVDDAGAPTAEYLNGAAVIVNAVDVAEVSPDADATTV
jgi:hypothetical protein